MQHEITQKSIVNIYRMICLQSNSFFLICICLAALTDNSLQVNDEIRSVKKDLKIVSTAEAVHQSDPTHETRFSNLTSDVKTQEDNLISELKSKAFEKNVEGIEIPESFKMGFYFIVGLSITAILFIFVKIYRMRLSRAERKYGVHSDRTTQELTPLPMAIDDDSDNEDHTLFDINRQVRVS